MPSSKSTAGSRNRVLPLTTKNCVMLKGAPEFASLTNENKSSRLHLRPCDQPPTPRNGSSQPGSPVIVPEETPRSPAFIPIRDFPIVNREKHKPFAAGYRFTKETM
jgi:hypothetical protein